MEIRLKKLSNEVGIKKLELGYTNVKKVQNYSCNTQKISNARG